MTRRKPWVGIESIEDGDKIKYTMPFGVRDNCVVYKIIGEAISPQYGVAIRFYSERVSHRGFEFHSYERVIAEEWITHWRGRRVRKLSSLSESRPVDSSTRNGTDDHQIVFPI